MRDAQTLRAVIAALRKRYGDIASPVTDPFEMILLENVAYLVDDARRLETFGRLREQVGLAPKAILARSAEEIARVIPDGGMRPLMRAEKLHECAHIAVRQGLTRLRSTMKADPERAKKMLREYPGVGEPYADRILLCNGLHHCLSPDSNALRVLLRLGFGIEHKSYGASYRSAVSATADAFTNARQAEHAHGVLRRHGQEVCRRSAPRCERCPVQRYCEWYRRMKGDASLR